MASTDRGGPQKPDTGSGLIPAAEDPGILQLVGMAVTQESLPPPPQSQLPALLPPRQSKKPPSDPPVVDTVTSATSSQQDAAANAGRHHKPGAVVSPEDTGTHLALELGWLSEGKVAAISSTGPAIASERELRELRISTFGWMLAGRDRIVVVILSLAWLASLAWFWMWWLEPGHRVGSFGVIANSFVLAYVTGFPAFFIFAVNRLRRVRPELPLPLLRVAFVVTRAPSEPWEVACRTLTAMLEQDLPYPYDVWLCDEQPSSEVSRWCAAHGVSISSRSGVRAYHRKTWPRRTKCKEGNLAYFYDRFGYRSYDVVAQLDCDHVPASTYLAQMLRPFADPAIGYVAAPSVCDANAESSWAARGRLHREATFHGPYQLGHNEGLSPVCIGSHYAVRTVALREIGGIGPDLAEDFSTSFLLSAAGWHGAFAIDAEAHGDGPNTFGAMVVQEFQWSRSLAVLLLGMVPRNLSRLSWKLRLRFSYSLGYYALLVGATAGGLALGPVAAITGSPWIHVNYAAFLGHWWLVSVWLIMIVWLLRRRRLLRPPQVPLVSWENWLYALTRWPYVALGLGAAMLNLVRPRQLTLKVTPKGQRGIEVFPARLMLPFAAISTISAGAALYGERFSSGAPGYVFLSVLAGLTYGLVTLLLPILHARESAATAGVSLVTATRRAVLMPLVLACVAFAPAFCAALFFPAYLQQAWGW
ncbi:MAG TPA: glycosyltransferase family 2 protein [Streptosporangiaceae bacterium]|nr:glycosyltransferase family 2 protein [Streptosporangiaceae bacterium]